MNRIRPKHPACGLIPSRTTNSENRCCSRDGWRCQCCGTRSNLEVHHKEFRSQGGDDSEENLITLCFACHSLLHHG